jgi:hypothetical protein
METLPDVLTLVIPFTKELLLFSLRDNRRRRLEVKGDMPLRNVTWMADGKGFFAANAFQTGAQLVHVDLRGNSRVPWTVNGRDVFQAGRASPDGRHIAIQRSAGNSNM